MKELLKSGSNPNDVDNYAGIVRTAHDLRMMSSEGNLSVLLNYA